MAMAMAGEASIPWLHHQNPPLESEDEEAAASSPPPPPPPAAASDDAIATNSISRVLRLVRNVVPGSDIARLQVRQELVP
jgi:flagellar basal body-associated protein FliL